MHRQFLSSRCQNLFFKFKLLLFEVNQMQYVYIFIGGALGALLRYLISFLNTDGGFPIGTLIANLTGAFVMGLLTALTIAFFSNHPTLKKAITTGFLGALTTFSTFQLGKSPIDRPQASAIPRCPLPAQRPPQATTDPADALSRRHPQTPN